MLGPSYDRRTRLTAELSTHGVAFDLKQKEDVLFSVAEALIVALSFGYHERGIVESLTKLGRTGLWHHAWKVHPCVDHLYQIE
jgi:hypothetical protein